MAACPKWRWVFVLGVAATSVEAASLTLDEARARALAQNPGLEASGAGWRAAQGAEKSARAFPNPEISIEAEDFGGDLDGWSESQTTLSWSQPFEAPGKRKARAEAARLAAEGARGDYRLRRLDLLAGVDRAFFELLGAQERLRIAEGALATAREVSLTVAALVEAGEVSPIESTRAASEEALAGIDLRAAEREEDLARRGLARLLGLEEPDFDGAVGILAGDATVPSEEEIATRVPELPDLARWKAETGRLESEVRLAKKSRWPDMGVSVGWRWYEATGEDAYVAGVGFGIPLFDRGTGAVLESTARLEEGRAEERAERVRLRAELGAARTALSQALDEVRTLGERVLPGARQVYEALGEGYRRGKFRLLDLLEARRTLAGTELRHVDALVRLNLARVDLDRLLGTHREAGEGEYR